MLKLWPLLILSPLVFGCQSQQALELERQLNEYAASIPEAHAQPARAEALFAQALSGSALLAAVDGFEAVETLGLRQIGAARFVQTRLNGSGRGAGCLDVSGTSFLSISGDSVLPTHRQERAVFEVGYQHLGGRLFITEILIGAESC